MPWRHIDIVAFFFQASLRSMRARDSAIPLEHFHRMLARRSRGGFG